jgi:hypothetical protein
MVLKQISFTVKNLIFDISTFFLLFLAHELNVSLKYCLLGVIYRLNALLFKDSETNLKMLQFSSQGFQN